MDRSALRDAIARELETNLLPFWRERSLDHVHGGFIAEMASDGTVRDDAPRGLILNARLLWTFSALFRELGDERDLALARRASLRSRSSPSSRKSAEKVHTRRALRISPRGASSRTVPSFAISAMKPPWR